MASIIASLRYVLVLLLATHALGEDLHQDEALPPGAAAPRKKRAKSPEAPADAPTNTPKVRGSSQKDAEGTEAPNRFQADTVIKSRYTLEGKPLEVDPD